VTKSIPDHCVAVGAPAIIIKRYCHESRTWKRTDSKGEFLG
jgi:acetyltransferase-like isoleucine patch superfamily enzyme